MAKYRKKPVVIEAVQWTGENWDEITSFIGPQAAWDGGQLIITTLEGNMTASKSDYIIRGVQGEFYPCKPDIFLNTYEEVHEFDGTESFLSEDYNKDTKPYRG